MQQSVPEFILKDFQAKFKGYFKLTKRIHLKDHSRLEPILSGGGQERGLRSGTLPHFLAIGLGEACQVAKDEMETDHARIERLAGI